MCTTVTSCGFINVHICVYRLSAKQWQGKNFGRFGESGAICQNITHQNFYNKTAGRLLTYWEKYTTNGYQSSTPVAEISQRMWPRVSSKVSSPHGLCSITTTADVSIT